MCRIVVRSLLALTCLSLFGAQLSGLHMHVDDHGYAGAPHAAHSHHHGGGDRHDHEHETDVTAIDLGTIATKQIFLPAALALAVVMILSLCQRVVPQPLMLAMPCGRVRWRPPLRAPPLSPALGI
jgi:hypothetical protein